MTRKNVISLIGSFSPREINSICVLIVAFLTALLVIRANTAAFVLPVADAESLFSASQIPSHPQLIHLYDPSQGARSAIPEPSSNHDDGAPHSITNLPPPFPRPCLIPALLPLLISRHPRSRNTKKIPTTTPTPLPHRDRKYSYNDQRRFARQVPHYGYRAVMLPGKL